MQGQTMDMFSKAVHAGHREIEKSGTHVPVIDLSSTYPTPDFEAAVGSLTDFAGGAADAANPVYARLYNRTVDAFEQGVAELEDAAEAVAFASGMAAITACLLACRMGGSNHVIGIRPLYGGTDHLLSSGLTGMDVSWCQPEEAAAAVRHDTGLVIVETPANPTLKLTDIAALADAVAPVPVLVDSTFATPILQRPLECGAVLSLHSATKFLGGHGDAVGGVVATNADWAARLRQVRIATGGIMHPMAAFLMHRGLKTLPLRVLKAQEAATIIAERLRGHANVDKVHYPGLDPAYPALRSQMQGPGSILSFELASGRRSVSRLLEALDMITPAVSLGSTDTLIQHPAGLTHQVVDEDVRESCGIADSLLRVSVGLESADDIWADLSQALDRAALMPRVASGN